MNKKLAIRFWMKLTIELVILIALILCIIYLVKSDDGILAKPNRGSAKEKLDIAIKTFTTTEGMDLEVALKQIQGIDDLQINKETGEYNIKIDGEDFLVISREITPEEWIKKD